MSQLPPPREQNEPPADREETSRLLVASVKDYAIFIARSRGYVMTWNPGAERIKGYKAEENIGQHFSKFYPPEAEQRGHPDHELRVAKAEGHFEEEGWRVRKDGSLVWPSVVITAVHDETGAGAHCRR